MDSFLTLIKDAPVASFIFGITLVTSVIDLLQPQQGITARFILHPYSMVRSKQYYRLLTAGLIHGGWLHLFFNMYVFYAFGFMLEQLIGSLNFGLIYVGSEIISGIPLVLRQKNNPQYFALGASGAIAGILFSFIILYPDLQLLLFVFPITAWVFGLLYLAFSFFAARQQADNIAHDAHFWGAVAGILLTLLLVSGSWEQIQGFVRYKLG